MLNASPLEEIQLYKSQLNEFLSRKFIDQPILLGFNNVLQSKFQTWILSDLNSYYDKLENIDRKDESSYSQLDLEFKTIKYFETLWIDFHYPIIKFFQFHHANFYNEILKTFEESQKDKSIKFKLKPVEIRKINDNFTKFIKQVYQFYHTLLKYFSTHFNNPLVPREFLDHLKFTVPVNAIQTTNPNLQANIVYLIHRCLLSLGDISRHRSFIELSYVNPCLSNKDFFKYRALTNKEKIFVMKPYYEKAFQFYKFCILLLPALNEPYNHIGMIYNIIDEKFAACYWFLRSQFTRIPDYKLGLNNLNTILKKKWFINNLININFDYFGSKKSGKFSFTNEDELNTTLICLIGYYYLPGTYRHGPNIVKNLKFSKVESDFFKVLFNSFDKLIEISPKDDLNFYVKQLVVLISFNKLIESSGKKSESLLEVSVKFNKFTFRYIEKLLDVSTKIELNDKKKSNILIILRLILNWLKENKVILKDLLSRPSTMEGIANALNFLICDIDNKKENEESSNIPVSQNIKIAQVIELLKSNSRPTRHYYFVEDVCFRDFSIIKFQFKDFKDDHLFQSNNINLLLGDITSYYQDNGIPSFLVNDATLKNEQVVSNDDSSVNIDVWKSTIFKSKITCYENFLRLQSVLLLGKKILDNNSYGIQLDYETARFLVGKTIKLEKENVETKDIQGDKMLSKKTKKKSKNKFNESKIVDGSEFRTQEEPFKEKPKESQIGIPVDLTVEESAPMREEKEHQAKIPTSLEEIESIILSHTTQLHDKILKAPDKAVGASGDTAVPTQDIQGKNDSRNIVQSLSFKETVDSSVVYNNPDDVGSIGVKPHAHITDIWNKKSLDNNQSTSESFKVANTNQPSPADYSQIYGVNQVPQVTRTFNHFSPVPHQFPAPYQQPAVFVPNFNAISSNSIHPGNSPFDFPSPHPLSNSTLSQVAPPFHNSSPPYASQPQSQTAPPTYPSSQALHLSQGSQGSFQHHFAQYYSNQQFVGSSSQPPSSSPEQQQQQQQQQQLDISNFKVQPGSFSQYYRY